MGNVQMIELASEIDSYLKRLFPVMRSITGPGNRKTLSVLKEIVPLETKEYLSGTQVYDWTIPDEWQVREAWIGDKDGNKLIDFQNCNIHLVSYSEPVHEWLTFDELKEHLHFHNDIPEAIPYITSYYNRNWGFCVNQSQYKRLSEYKGRLEVMIDSDLNPKGSLTIGELIIPGRSKKEILISTYICHPSLANDNLSGLLMTAFLARELLKKDLQWSYRFIWIPETIGAIAYCSMNEAIIREIDTGLSVSTVGGPGKLGYKMSWQKDHYINRIIEKNFNEDEKEFVIYPFDIHGSDERQFSSQGFRINMATVCKDRYYEYPYYHTSLDNLSYVNGKQIMETLKVYLGIIKKLEGRRVYRTVTTSCEIMLSKHGLYPKYGGTLKPNGDNFTNVDLRLWVLFYSDGKNSLDEIADMLGIDVKLIEGEYRILEKKGIVVAV